MGDVARLAGVVVSEEAARELVAAIDELAKLAAPKGASLHPRLAGIRRDLANCSTRENARPDASTEVVARHDLLAWDCVVDTESAARTLGITPDGVRWLCRNKRLERTRAVGRWWISEASLKDYRARRSEQET